MTRDDGARRRPAAAVARSLAGAGLLGRPVVAHVVVVGGFTCWALLLGLGSESMYWLSDYLPRAQVLAMQLASLALTVAGAAALCWRRRRPVHVAAAMGGLAVVSLLATGATNGFELGIAIALCSVAATRRARDAALVALAVVLPVALVAWIAPLVEVVGTRVVGGSPDDPAALRSTILPGALEHAVTPAWAVTALPVVVLALVGIVWGTLIRTRRQRLTAVAEAAAARAAEEAQRAQLTQADERARIAREMHDVIAHSITVMVALGGGAAAALDRAPEQARVALDELVETGRTALDDVRRILGVLHAADRPPSDVVPMQPMPGGADLPRLVERFRTAGLPVRTSGLVVTGLDDVDATVQLAVFRIVQESLTNTLRHAPGTARVDVDVRRLPEALEILVSDHGPGTVVAASPGSGHGLVGIAERAAAFGGTVEAGPCGPGWRVRALLSVPNEGET